LSLEHNGSTSSLRVRGDGLLLVNTDTAVPAAGALAVGITLTSSSIGLYVGSGAPTLSATKGSIYLRSDGSTTNDRAYIATDSSGAWTALTTAT
jgi:hypothetical protein